MTHYTHTSAYRPQVYQTDDYRRSVSAVETLPETLRRNRDRARRRADIMARVWIGVTYGSMALSGLAVAVVMSLGS